MKSALIALLIWAICNAAAWTVIAWLGEAADDSDKAFDLIGKLSEYYGDGVDRLREPILHLLENPGYIGFGCWHGLNKLMQRDFWGRLWIIQELVLSSSRKILLCGTRTIDWKTLCYGMGTIWGLSDPLLLQGKATLDLFQIIVGVMSSSK